MAEEHALIATLVRAFHDDPIVGYLIRGDNRRIAGMAEFFGMALRESFAGGSVRRPIAVPWHCGSFPMRNAGRSLPRRHWADLEHSGASLAAGVLCAHCARWVASRRRTPQSRTTTWPWLGLIPASAVKGWPAVLSRR